MFERLILILLILTVNPCILISENIVFVFWFESVNNLLMFKVNLDVNFLHMRWSDIEEYEFGPSCSQYDWIWSLMNWDNTLVLLQFVLTHKLSGMPWDEAEVIAALGKIEEMVFTERNVINLAKLRRIGLVWCRYQEEAYDKKEAFWVHYFQLL